MISTILSFTPLIAGNKADKNVEHRTMIKGGKPFLSAWSIVRGTGLLKAGGIYEICRPLINAPIPKGRFEYSADDLD